MASYSYIISRKEDADGNRSVYLLLRLTRLKHIRIKTSVKVRSCMWKTTGTSSGNEIGSIVVPKRGRLNMRDVECAEKAKRDIEDIAMRAQMIVSVMGVDFCARKGILAQVIEKTRNLAVADITRRAVMCALAGLRQENGRTLWGFCETFLQDEDVSKARAAHYRSLMRDIYRWAEYRKAMDSHEFILDIDSLNADDVMDLRSYLSQERMLRKEQPELFEDIMNSYPQELTPRNGHHWEDVNDRGQNTVIGKLKKLKVLYNWMRRRKITECNPFEGVTIGAEVYGIPFYLTIDERNKLAEARFPSRPQLEVQRDIFIFQCLVGCRVSDLTRMTEANITDGVLEYVPHKTKDEQAQVKPRVPLTERALALVERYRGVDSGGRLFPFISTTKYNIAIKDMLKLAGIDRPVIVRNSVTGENESRPIWEVASSHMARRTFIGNVYEKVQDPNLIGRMSGHVEGSKAFSRYRTITDDVLKGVVDLID